MLVTMDFEHVLLSGYYLRNFFFTKPLTSESLFSTSPIFVLRTVVVIKPLVSGILFSTSPMFVFKIVIVTKPLTSGMFYQHLQFVIQIFLSVFY